MIITLRVSCNPTYLGSSLISRILRVPRVLVIISAPYMLTASCSIGRQSRGRGSERVMKHDLYQYEPKSLDLIGSTQKSVYNSMFHNWLYPTD